MNPRQCFIEDSNLHCVHPNRSYPTCTPMPHDICHIQLAALQVPNSNKDMALVKNHKKWPPNKTPSNAAYLSKYVLNQCNKDHTAATRFQTQAGDQLQNQYRLLPQSGSHQRLFN